MELIQINGIQIVFRQLAEREIQRDLFSTFIRRQVVQKCWRMLDGRALDSS